MLLARRRLALPLLRATARAYSAGNEGPNHAILDMLKRNQEEETQSPVTNPYKIRAFKVAIKAIRELDHPIRSATEAKGLKGVGAGILRRIQEHLETAEHAPDVDPAVADKLQRNIIARAELAQVTGLGTMGDPPAKRQHQDVDIARSEIWLPDGNVVLQAHDTQFRVHWGVLSLHSSVFRDIQGLPQPPEQPSVEGCPVVELSDSVEDVNNLLKALYNPLFFLKKAIPLSVIASHIRLGRKYEFKNILQSIVERLTYEYPTTLEEYEALPQQISPTRIVDYPGVHHDMITLARENNLLSVLPLAYYRAQVTGSAPVTVFDGIPRGDGTVATLSLTDQRACVVGRIKISQAQWDAGNTFGWVEDDVAGCQDPAACMRNKSLFIHRHVVKGTLATFAPLPLSLDSLKLCAVCTQDANTKTIAGRKRMWELLPTFFDLPPWDELKYDL